MAKPLNHRISYDSFPYPRRYPNEHIILVQYFLTVWGLTRALKENIVFPGVFWSGVTVNFVCQLDWAPR